MYGVSQTDTSMSFEANRLKMVDTRETSGLALRLVRDGRIGFSTTTNLEEEDALVERALEMAPFGAEALLEMPSAVDYPSVDVHDHRLAELVLDDMRHLGQSVIDAVRAEWAPGPVRGQGRQECDQNGVDELPRLSCLLHQGHDERIFLRPCSFRAPICSTSRRARHRAIP